MSWHLTRAAVRSLTCQRACMKTNLLYTTSLIRRTVSTETNTPPVNTEAITNVADTLQVVDPPFVELGLGSGWMPYNYIELGLESLYLSTGMPWWATISVGAVAIRLLTLPLFISAKKFNIRTTNSREKTTKLTTALSDANASGDFQKRQMASRDYFAHMRETKTGVWHAYPTILMASMFTSCFFALRNICNVPLPSLEASSFLWLDSLIAADPYRVLPLTTGLVLGAGIHFGFKFGTPLPANAQLLKYIPIAPVLLMPIFAGNMSGAVQIFMLINSAITAGGNVALLLPAVQQKLNFPEKLVPLQSSKDAKPMTQSFKEGWEDRRQQARVRAEAKNNTRRLKAEVKRRQKELKARSPPVTYEIGTQAVLAATPAPDFHTYGKPKLYRKVVVDEDKTEYRTITLPQISNRY